MAKRWPKLLVHVWDHLAPYVLTYMMLITLHDVIISVGVDLILLPAASMIRPDSGWVSLRNMDGWLHCNAHCTVEKDATAGATTA